MTDNTNTAATSGDAPANSELTIEEITQLIDKHTDRDFGLIVEPFARAVERKVLARIERAAAPAPTCGLFTVEQVQVMIAADRAQRSATASGDELPPLPEPVRFAQWTGGVELAYTKDQMRQYARDAIAASRRAAGGEVAPWTIEYMPGSISILDEKGEYLASGERHEMEAIVAAHNATPTSASAGQAAPAMIEQYDGPWPTVEMTVAGKRMLEKQTSIEHIKKYSAGIANSIYEAMHAASPVGIAAQPAEGAGQAGQVAACRHCDGRGSYPHKGSIVDCRVCGGAGEIARTERAAAPADIATTYKAQRDNLLAFIQNAPVSSGVCCCGDSMEKHYSPDHSAVDMWDHSVRCYAEEFAKFDTTHQPSAQKGGA